MLAVARLPEVLLDAIADKPLSAAQVATLHALMQQVGEKLISERAASLPLGSTTADIFAFLTTGRRPPHNAVSISVARGKKGGKNTSALTRQTSRALPRAFERSNCS
jgi:hypothetical protein